MVLSVTTAHRVRKNHCEEVADGTITRFSDQAKETGAHLVVHFDGEKGIQVLHIIVHFQVRSSLPILAAGRRRWTGW